MKTETTVVVEIIGDGKLTPLRCWHAAIDKGIDVSPIIQAVMCGTKTGREIAIEQLDEIWADDWPTPRQYFAVEDMTITRRRPPSKRILKELANPDIWK